MSIVVSGDCQAPSSLCYQDQGICNRIAPEPEDCGSPVATQAIPWGSLESFSP